MKGLESMKNLRFGLILAALFVGLTACQKKSNSSGRNVVQTPVGVSANCTNCFTQPEFIATTDSEKVNGALYMGLDFYGQLNSNYNFNDPKIPTIYQGPVQAQGRIEVKGIDSMLCNAPVGVYVLRTITSGTWNQGVVGSGFSGAGPGGLRLEGVGNNGARIIVSVLKGIIYNNNTQVGTNKFEINRLGGTFAIEAVNNQPCPYAGTIELY